MSESYSFKHPIKRYAAHGLDALGAFWRHLSPLPDKPFDPHAVKKILLIRLDHWGDVLMSRPALDAVLAHFPDARIDFLVAADHAPLFLQESRLNVIPVTHHWFSRHSSWLEKMTAMEDLIPMLRREHYDLGIDFRGDLRNILVMTLAGIPEKVGYAITGGGFLLTRQGSYDRDLHQVDLNMKLLTAIGIEGLPQRRPFLHKKESREFTKSSRPMQIIMHPGAGYPSKKWPEENFRVLIDKILAHYPWAHVILIGTREEQDRFPVLGRVGCLSDLRGKTRIEDLPALFDAAHLYIGNDSGPAHLAALQGLAGVIIFSGTNEARLWRPWSDRFQIIQHQVPCSPCEAKVCPLGHHDCMQKITVDQIFAAVENLIRNDEHAAHRS